MKKKIERIRFDEWVSEINKPFVKPDNCFFLSEFMKKTSLKRTTARAKIDELIRNGRVRKDVIVHEGKTCNIFTILE